MGRAKQQNRRSNSYSALEVARRAEHDNPALRHVERDDRVGGAVGESGNIFELTRTLSVMAEVEQMRTRAIEDPQGDVARVSVGDDHIPIGQPCRKRDVAENDRPVRSGRAHLGDWDGVDRKRRPAGAMRFLAARSEAQDNGAEEAGAAHALSWSGSLPKVRRVGKGASVLQCERDGRADKASRESRACPERSEGMGGVPDRAGGAKASLCPCRARPPSCIPIRPSPP